MPVLCVDVSNYTGELSHATLERWKAAGVGLVIVQAVNPPPGYPPCVDRQQAEAVLTAGLALDAYVYHWTGTDVAKRNADRFMSYGLPVRRWWGDHEDVSPGDPWQREREMPDLAAHLDPLGWLPSGYYTGGWWVDGYLPRGTTVLAGRAAWLSQYDDVVDASVVRLTGGAAACAIKQYAGSSVFEGQGGVDLNVLSDEEAAWLSPDTRLTLEPAAPAPEPEAPAEPEPAADLEWVAKKSYVVSTLGMLRGDELDALLKAPNKQARKEQAERIRALIDQALAA